MDQHTVLRAKVKLLSTNRRILRGPDALWVYRTLTEVNPAAYGSMLAHVLVEASRAPQLDELPAHRRELVEEAVTVATALHPGDPFRTKVLTQAVEALRQLPTVP